MTNNLSINTKFSPVSFTWTVENFSTLCADRIDSPAIPLPDQAKIGNFILELYPQASRNMFDPKAYTFINLDMQFLGEDDGSSECIIWSFISLINSKGQKCFVQGGQSKFCNKKYFEFNWQYQIYRNHLLCSENRLLVNDKLTIRCVIYKMDKLENEILPKFFYSGLMKYNSMPTCNKIFHDYRALLSSGKHSDVLLVSMRHEISENDDKVSTGELKAHKCILSARSPVFAAMFEHDCAESVQNRVEIVDISFGVLQLLLEYIYSGKIYPPNQYNSVELLVAADKYEITCLKAECEKHLATHLDVGSVATILAYADMHQAGELKRKCMDYISKHIDEVKCTEGWKAMSKNRPDIGTELFLYSSNKKTSHQATGAMEPFRFPRIYESRPFRPFPDIF